MLFDWQLSRKYDGDTNFENVTLFHSFGLYVDCRIKLMTHQKSP